MNSRDVQEQAKDRAREGASFARRHEAGVKRLGRVGVAAEGVVYLLIAWLAAQVALGADRGPADTSGALAQVAGTPGGVVLLVLLTLGFVAMFAWQVLTVVTADETKHRLSAVVKAVVALALGGSCVRFLLGRGTSSGQQQQTATQRLLEAPGGGLLVAAVGLVVVVVGIVTVVRGVRRSFEDKVEGSLPGPLVALGVAGTVARGIAFAVLGGLVMASAHGDTAKSRGLDAALREIVTQPFGVVLLLLVALGLAAFGVFEIATARRRARA